MTGDFPKLTKDTKPLIQENHTNSKSEGVRHKENLEAVRGIKVINTSLLRINSHNIKLTILKWTVAFSIFTVLCNHHFYLVFKSFKHPKRKPPTH